MKARKHKRKKKYSIKRWQLFFVSVIGTMLLFISIFAYPKTHANSYDSSTDGSEVAEMQQVTIPSDVLKRIEEEKSKATLFPSLSVLGVQTEKKFPSVVASVHVPILMYHYVEYVQDANDKTRISLNTTPYILEDEIKTLINAGYTFMTNKELVDVLDGNAKLPGKPVLLTFDDGYRDFYTDAYPILKKYHAKATQYVIAGFLGYNNHLLVSQLQQIANERLVEIGAHTIHHVWLKGQTLQTVTDEVLHSKIILEQIIHKPVVSFAYPFGAFDQQALDAVKNAGFTSAVSTIPGIEQKQENKHFLYRLRPGGRTGENFLSWIESQK